MVAGCALYTGTAISCRKVENNLDDFADLSSEIFNSIMSDIHIKEHWEINILEGFYRDSGNAEVSRNKTKTKLRLRTRIYNFIKYIIQQFHKKYWKKVNEVNLNNNNNTNNNSDLIIHIKHLSFGIYLADTTGKSTLKLSNFSKENIEDLSLLDKPFLHFMNIADNI